MFPLQAYSRVHPYPWVFEMVSPYLHQQYSHALCDNWSKLLKNSLTWICLFNLRIILCPALFFQSKFHTDILNRCYLQLTYILADAFQSLTNRKEAKHVPRIAFKMDILVACIAKLPLILGVFLSWDKNYWSYDVALWL